MSALLFVRADGLQLRGAGLTRRPSEALCWLHEIDHLLLLKTVKGTPGVVEDDCGLRFCEPKVSPAATTKV